MVFLMYDSLDYGTIKRSIRARDRVVVGLKTTYTIGGFHHSRIGKIFHTKYPIKISRLPPLGAIF
jgi:hypothetical protein